MAVHLSLMNFSVRYVGQIGMLSLMMNNALWITIISSLIASVLNIMGLKGGI